jgi:hypothetical protein
VDQADPATPSAVFMIIEPVDRAGVECLLVEALRACSCKLRRTDMLAAHDRVKVYDACCWAEHDRDPP